MMVRGSEIIWQRLARLSTKESIKNSRGISWISNSYVRNNESKGTAGFNRRRTDKWTGLSRKPSTVTFYSSKVTKRKEEMVEPLASKDEDFLASIKPNYDDFKEPHPQEEGVLSSEAASGDYTLKLSDEELQNITGGDPDLIKKVQYIQLEHEVYRQEGMKVPARIKLNHWKELVDLTSPGGRRKFYNFLWTNEMKSENDKERKARIREERLKDLPPLPPREVDNFGMTYGLTRNTLFLRLYDSTINKFYHNKVVNAMMFSRPLVIDCGYDEFMTPREAKNCAKQLELVITDNRTHEQPFDLHFCNARPDSKVIEYLQRFIPTLYDDSFPINITEKSYLEVLPRKELVYLSPHSRDVLEEYREDEIYIVGAMVDKSDPRPFSLAKAKKEGLRIKQLPLDRHLMWGLGGKSLTLNQMARIMLDLRLTGDWKAALDHVPRRKLQREFHPYDKNGMPLPVEETPRRENRSQVLEDFELIGQRKGFRRSDRNFGNGNSSSNNPGYFQRPNKAPHWENSQAKVRSIKYDSD